MKNDTNTRSLWPATFVLTSFILVALLVYIFTSSQFAAAQETNASQPLDLTNNLPNCRIGLAAMGSNQREKLPELGVGWFINFTVNTTSINGIEYYPVIRLKQPTANTYTVTPPLTEGGLGAAIAARPGATWVVGNEVDRGPDPGSDVSPQDALQPTMYARAYHDVYHFIKARDPEALVAISGLVQVTPGRLQYLDIVWDEYLRLYGQPMPVDVWNMHLYILPEATPTGQPNSIASIALGTNPALAMRESGGNAALCGILTNNVYCFADHSNMNFFRKQIVDMRTWMKARGQQFKPLIISEYSILYPCEDENSDGACDFLLDEYGQGFPPQRVIAFLHDTLAYLEGSGGVDPNLGYPLDNNRLVQQSLWFSIYFAGAGSVSNLYADVDLTQRTLVGNAFAQEVGNRTPRPNLRPINPASPMGFVEPPATTTTVTLSVDVLNNGSATVANPFAVTFYRDAALTQVIGSVVLSDQYGCAIGTQKASVSWADLGPGVHRYWVEVDTVANEIDLTDNVASGTVIINPEQIFLPVTYR